MDRILSLAAAALAAALFLAPADSWGAPAKKGKKKGGDAAAPAEPGPAPAGDPAPAPDGPRDALGEAVAPEPETGPPAASEPGGESAVAQEEWCDVGGLRPTHDKKCAYTEIRITNPRRTALEIATLEVNFRLQGGGKVSAAKIFHADSFDIKFTDEKGAVSYLLKKGPPKSPPPKKEEEGGATPTKAGGDDDDDDDDAKKEAPKKEEPKKEEPKKAAAPKEKPKAGDDDEGEEKAGDGTAPADGEFPATGEDPPLAEETPGPEPEPELLEPKYEPVGHAFEAKGVKLSPRGRTPKLVAYADLDGTEEFDAADPVEVLIVDVGGFPIDQEPEVPKHGLLPQFLSKVDKSKTITVVDGEKKDDWMWCAFAFINQESRPVTIAFVDLDGKSANGGTRCSFQGRPTGYRLKGYRFNKELSPGEVITAGSMVVPPGGMMGMAVQGKLHEAFKNVGGSVIARVGTAEGKDYASELYVVKQAGAPPKDEKGKTKEE